MSEDDINYLQNYKADQLYINTAPTGAYATLVADGEDVIGEIKVTERIRLAVSAFYSTSKKDYDTYKITRMKFKKSTGWIDDGHVKINQFELLKLIDFNSILSAIDVSNRGKTRINIDDIDLGTMRTLLNSTISADVIKGLSDSPELKYDIFALASKRKSLQEFDRMMSENLREPEWQAFFEKNPWIFGLGLHYVFLDKVSKKMEAVTTGASFDGPGKRADGLMRTRAEASQYVFIEIKTPNTDLLKSTEYRSGCWASSNELSGAVTQSQKTVFEFSKSRFIDQTKDDAGNLSGNYVYSVNPKSYLIIGNLKQISMNPDKFSCFELYRKSVAHPEIITFDELYERAKCIVMNIDSALDQSASDRGQET